MESWGQNSLLHTEMQFATSKARRDDFVLKKREKGQRRSGGGKVNNRNTMDLVTSEPRLAVTTGQERREEFELSTCPEIRTEEKENSSLKVWERGKQKQDDEMEFSKQTLHKQTKRGETGMGLKKSQITNKLSSNECIQKNNPQPSRNMLVLGKWKFS